MPYKDAAKRNEYQRLWIQKKRKTKAHSAYTAQRKLELKRKVAKAKEKPCVDCGIQLVHYAMDFDHTAEDKNKGIARMANYGNSWESIQAEIAKCDLVCANCHRIRTHERFVCNIC
jgi:hypothetical protein